jgi:hypothetical protein
MATETDPQAQFWQWFRANGARLRTMMYGQDNDVRYEASEELREAVQAVQPGLVLELGSPPSAPIAELIVSADGHRELVDTVKDFVESAPALPGWEVVAFRPRMNLADSLVIRLEDEEVGPGDIWFRIEEGDDGLDLTLFVQGLNEQNRRLRGLGAMLLAEHGVGERDAMTLLASLEVEPLPDDPAGEGLRPFADLVSLFDKVREKKYPPPGSLPLDQAGWQAMQGSINDAPALVFLDAGLRQVAGHPAYDCRLVVTIPFQARDDGMPDSDEELAAVQELGSHLADELQHEQQSLHALTVVTQGRRDLILYTHDARAAQQRLEELRAGASRTFEFDVSRDSFWGTYRTFIDNARPAEEAEEE